jgi:translation initiation factor IF-1
MVKNTTGGKGSKSLARKLLSSSRSDSIRESTCPLEQYAIVTKMLGNGMCYVSTIEHGQLLCHIRMKFSGRSKRSNFLSIGSYVLIGLRDWETTIKNTDLLEVYDTVPSHLLSFFPSSLDTSSSSSAAVAEIEFDDTIDELAIDEI